MAQSRKSESPHYEDIDAENYQEIEMNSQVIFNCKMTNFIKYFFIKNKNTKPKNTKILA